MTPRRLTGTALAVAWCLLVWQIVASYHAVVLGWLWTALELDTPIPSWSYLSSPLAVFNASLHEIADGRLLQATAETSGHALSALAIAHLVGILLAEWLKNEGPVALAFRPIFRALNGIPPVTLLPVALIAFGLGTNSVVAIAFYGAFLSILFITLDGFQEARRDVQTSIAHMGYSAFGAWLWRMSSASSQLATAAREGFRWALILSVVAEMHGAVAGGLGSYIDSARLNQDYPLVYVGIILCGICAITIQLLLDRAMHHFHRLLIWTLLGRFAQPGIAG
jgi:NitT/TauT family transport system permease protein